MSNVFTDLSGRLQHPVTWIDFEAYAKRVFAGDPADWLTNAHRFADTLVQAQKLVCSDVVAFDVTQALLANTENQPDVSLADRLVRWQSDQAARRFNTDVLNELFDRLDKQAALVLALPAPSRLLRLWGAVPPFDFDDLDDVSSALVSLLREQGERTFLALMITCDESDGPSDDELEACAPLQKSANYYGWGLAWRLEALPEGALPERLLAKAKVDTVLVDAWSGSALTAQGEPRLGGGLNEAYWCADAATQPRHPGMRFGRIPPQAEPERVANHLQQLRS